MSGIFGTDCLLGSSIFMVCPSRRSFKYEKDALILQRSILRDDGEYVGDPSSTFEERLQHIQHMEERLVEA